MGLIPHDQPREYTEKWKAKSGIEVGLAAYAGSGCRLGMSTNREVPIVVQLCNHTLHTP